MFADEHFLCVLPRDVSLQVLLNFERLLALLALKFLIAVNLEVRLQLLTGTDNLTANMTNMKIFLVLRVFTVDMPLQPLPSFTTEVTLIAFQYVVTLLVQP